MGLLKESIHLYDILPEDIFLRLNGDLKYGWKNNNASNKDQYTSWGKTEEDILDSLIYISVGSYIKYKIKKHLRTSDLDLSRIHINGQTNGQASLFHKDEEKDGTYTFILFTEDSWNSNWGGEFVIHNPFSGKYEYYPYIPNSGILIDSTWEHRGNSPNNMTYKLRTSVAFMYCDLNVRDKYDWKKLHNNRLIS